MTVLVDVRELSHRYPDGRESLSGVSFCLDAGERVALIGPNGAGKSTLLSHLNGVLPDTLTSSNAKSDDGVWINGRKVCVDNLEFVRQQVGLLFQDPDDQLFCPTVLDDVCFGPLNLGKSPEQARDDGISWLARLGVGEDLLDRPPHRLSMGERKRVCLAGILACEPSLLALDEPTSNLDPRGRRELIALLGDLPHTLLVATHDLQMVQELCARVIVLDGGSIRADGPESQVLHDRELMLEHGLEAPAL